MSSATTFSNGWLIAENSALNTSAVTTPMLIHELCLYAMASRYPMCSTEVTTHCLYTARVQNVLYTVAS